MRRFPVITPSLLGLLEEDERILCNQLSRWRKQGLIIQLKKGLYLLNQEERQLQPSKFFLANQMIFPSYVSRESALAFYYLIPETAYQVTSVTTGKPMLYDTPEGSFSYRHIKKSLFFGFETMRDERGFEILIAEPEKALLDFIYLNLAKFSLYATVSSNCTVEGFA
jgi:predicted transcriptional regulator of viral defense system